MKLWEKSAKRRFKIYGLILGIPIVFLLMVGLLVESIGYVGDLRAKPHLNRMKEEINQNIEDFRNKGGYPKPVYFGELQKGNAWEFYKRAIQEFEKTSKTESLNLNLFSRGAKVDTAELYSFVSKNKHILDEIRKGVETKNCLLPLEYEKGAEMRFPDYMSLRNLSKLLVAHGYFEQKEGRMHQAVRDYLDAIRIGQDISGGDRTLLGQMIGIVTLGTGAVPIAECLKTFSFSSEDLREIARVLHHLSISWPTIGEALMTETWIMIYTAETIDDLNPFIPERLLSRGTYRILSWSNLFSVKKSLVESITLLQQHAKDVSHAENQNFDEVIRINEMWDKRIRESHNVITYIAIPNMGSSMAKRRMEGMSKLRLRGLASLTQLYFLQNKYFPQTLNEIEAGEMKALLMDPMTGTPWQYRVFADGDSCEIFSSYREKLDRPQDISHIATITLGPPM
jgi:hypothetical protein